MQENENRMISMPEVQVGYAYVPVQLFRELYSVEEALQQGTLFQQLNIPMEVYGPMGN